MKICECFICDVNITTQNASIWCIDFHDILTDSLEIKKTVKNEKRE